MRFGVFRKAVDLFACLLATPAADAFRDVHQDGSPGFHGFLLSEICYVHTDAPP
jgi:hypothetical protein